MRVIPWVFAVIATFQAAQVFAWERWSYEDATVVQRSPLIVVGRLDRDSITTLPRRDGVSEFGAKLIIRSIVRGNDVAETIPVILHHGLNTRPAEEYSTPKHGWPAGWNPHALFLIDTADLPQTLLDVAIDQIWFLRRLGGDLGRDPDPAADWGILDPQDVQPIKLLDYFECYLSPDPAARVREAVARDPDLAVRGSQFLEHELIREYAAISDPRRRVERLMPYVKSRTYFGDKPQPMDIVVAAGDCAGPYLLAALRESRNEQLTEELITAIGRIHYRPALSELTSRLELDNRYFAELHLPRDWSKDASREKVRAQCGEVYYLVCALESYGETSTLPLLAETRSSWAAMVDEPKTQIIEQCDISTKIIQRLAGAHVAVRSLR